MECVDSHKDEMLACINSSVPEVFQVSSLIILPYSHVRTRIRPIFIIFKVGGSGLRNSGKKDKNPVLALACGSMPFHRAQKLSISRAQPPPSFPRNGCWPHQKHYARGRINHRCINSYILFSDYGTSLVRIIPATRAFAGTFPSRLLYCRFGIYTLFFIFISSCLS